MTRANGATEGTKIILTGVGGQGVVFATRLLARAATVEGKDVLASETHGMSQRGGSVTSHLKLGGSLAPLIRPGTADLLLAFDATEGLRNLTYLAAGGRAYLSDDLPVPDPVRNALLQRGIRLRSVPAATLAAQLGHAAVANVILLAFAAADGALPVRIESLLEALGDLAPRNLDVNRAALETGLQAAKAAQGEEPAPSGAVE